jgi:hypothetical protein
MDRYRNDSTKCYQAMRKIKSKKAKKPLKIYDKNKNLVGSESVQVEIITQHFQKLFTIPNNEYENKPTFKPAKLKNPFTKDEISKTSKRLKNQKSPGIDNINAELIKYAPDEIHDEIAQIYNKTCETDGYPSVLKIGILHPLAKPPKKKDSKDINLRPIILLSVLRKILAMCMIDRTWQRLKTKIPNSQAAYQKGSQLQKRYSH